MDGHDPKSEYSVKSGLGLTIGILFLSAVGTLVSRQSPEGNTNVLAQADANTAKVRDGNVGECLDKTFVSPSYDGAKVTTGSLTVTFKAQEGSKFVTTEYHRSLAPSIPPYVVRQENELVVKPGDTAGFKKEAILAGPKVLKVETISEQNLTPGNRRDLKAIDKCLATINLK